MKKQVTVVSFFLFLGHALAQGPQGAQSQGFGDSWRPACALGIRYDSYGIGLEDGFLNTDYFKNPNPFRSPLDSRCYALGASAGRELKSRFGNSQSCGRGFAQGKVEGMKSAVQFGADLDECFQAGYKAGISQLDRGARDGDTLSVGTACVSAYSGGRRDAETVSPANPPLDEPAMHCYQLGYFEGR